MLLGVISDTHGHARNTLDGLRLFGTFGVEQILHCGDIGSPIIPKLFSVPTHFVFGNVDQDEEELRQAIQEAGHHCLGRFGSLELEGVSIAVIHGDDVAKWTATVNANVWDLVCSGHTHRRESRRIQKTLLLNPGAVYRATPHSVAIVDLPKLEVQFLEF
jgi:putative phosphoesterase